jgi:AcrR family transcriptional regulator
VNYHFGSKEGLLRAVFLRRFDPLNAQRLRQLDAAEDAAGAEGPSLEQILHAFIAPTVPMCRAHPEFMKFVGRMHLEPDQFQWDLLREGSFAELVRRFQSALIERLPRVSLADLWWRMTFTIGALVHAWTCWDQMELMSGGAVSYDGDERLVERLVSFAAAGLAPPSRPEGSR